MENVDFLNLEYVLLRVFDISRDILASLGFSFDGSQTQESQAAHLVSGASLTVGIVLLCGMVATLVLFALAVWVRIKLLVTEHEGFHGKEHAEHEAAHAHAQEHPKNSRWEGIAALASEASESDWRRAILEADIMLGDLLTVQGYRGEGIGEKLRDANPLQFSTLDLAWKAHKVRNDIAHQGEGYHLSQREANATIDLYRRVFEEFGFI